VTFIGVFELFSSKLRLYKPGEKTLGTKHTSAVHYSKSRDFWERYRGKSTLSKTVIL